MSDEPSAVPPALTSAAPSSKRSGLAIASLILGILGVTCFLPVVGPILAIAFGIMALSQINESRGAVTGHGQAVAGLVLGGVGVLLIPALIMAAILFPALHSARERAGEARCITNVKLIGLACAVYADDYNGRLPQILDVLTNPVTTANSFICPSAKNKNQYSYEFTGVTNKWGSSPSIIVLREIEANHSGRRMVLYNDGHVELQKD